MDFTRCLLFLSCLLLAAGCGGSSGTDAMDAPVTPPAPAIFASRVLSFDGVDDIASVSPPVGHFSFANGLTIEAWIRPGSLPSASEGTRAFLGHHGDTNFSLLGGGTDRLLCSISTPATNSVTSPIGALQVGVWQHIACTYDLTTMRLYIDGVEVATQAHMGTPKNLSMLEFGHLPTVGMNFPYEGEIDEVRVWGLVRSPQQITDGMHNAVAPNATGLLGYYRSEGTTQTVVDTSQHGIDGALGTDPVNADALDPTRIAPN